MYIHYIYIYRDLFSPFDFFSQFALLHVWSNFSLYGNIIFIFDI
jgi:hypothetical protein